MILKKKNNNSGFSLLEALVAITIFTLGVTAATTAIAQAIKLSFRVESKVIAANLAQEGIEIVRNIRDTNWISLNAWDAGLADGSGCVQYDSLLFDSGCFGGSANLKFNGVYYSHNASGPGVVSTIFNRTVTIAKDPINTNKMLVTSKVTCGSGCQITLQETLYNWK